MFSFLKHVIFMFALLLFSVAVNCLHRLEEPARAIEISIGLRTLLQDLNIPIRITAMVCWDTGKLLDLLIVIN